MKIHLTQISASGARAVQDWRGTFKFRSEASSGPAGVGAVTTAGGGGRLYASVHHPRRNVQVPEAETVGTGSVVDERLSTLLVVERVLGLVQSVAAVDEFIGTLHPLAVEQVAASFAERTGLLETAVEALLRGALGRVVEVQKGRRAVAGVLRRLVEAGTQSGLAVKVRRAGCGGEASWRLLDTLMAGYLGEAKEPVDGLVEASDVLVTSEPEPAAAGPAGTGRTKSLVCSLDRRAIGRFLMVHPRGLGLLKALLPWTNEAQAVEGICDVAEDVHRRLPGGQKVDDLWNLLIAVLSRDGGAAEVVNSRLGNFLDQNIHGFA